MSQNDKLHEATLKSWEKKNKKNPGHTPQLGFWSVIMTYYCQTTQRGFSTEVYFTTKELRATKHPFAWHVAFDKLRKAHFAFIQVA